MSNKEKIEKIEEMIVEMAKIRNENVEECLSELNSVLDQLYIRFKIMLEGIKELSGNKEGD